MSLLLLEPPISVNPIYLCITKDAESGVYLDYLIKELYFSKYKVEISIKDIYKYLPFLKTNIEKLNQKLLKLGFLSIVKQPHSYIYSLNITKYEEFMNNFRGGAR